MAAKKYGNKSVIFFLVFLQQQVLHDNIIRMKTSQIFSHHRASFVVQFLRRCTQVY